jgi:lactoylglutathione lyase
MKLAKPCIDVGIRTSNREAMLDFWTGEVGLPYEELLKIGNGVQQHRLGLNGSVFKLNHSRNPLADTNPAGYHELQIAKPVDAPVPLSDPDGNLVSLVPQGHNGITHIGMTVHVRSLERSSEFFAHALQAEEISPGHFRWATTVFQLIEMTDLPLSGGMDGPGYRYLTVQVHKVDLEHEALLARGAKEAVPPRTLGSTARISFITDPDGNWIEISQRASLTGDLSSD